MNVLSKTMDVFVNEYGVLNDVESLPPYYCPNLCLPTGHQKLKTVKTVCWNVLLSKILPSALMVSGRLVSAAKTS